ncbi:hypothetical protein ABZ697_27660 [Streptomyces albidoflavus]|uniref:hypothetical protein n=1 Tax=Streptomyces albidoflavus TaxID=1886 RepID=UPI0033DBB465
MNGPTPYDPTTYLVSHDQQITAPYLPDTEPLPPMSPLRSLWRHFGRLAPGLVTTTAAALAWLWHEQLPDGSAQPLWISGSLAALAAAAGTVSAAKQHGEAQTTRFAYAAGGTLALLGVAAWTPHSALRALLWLVSTAAVYAVCAPWWRDDRHRERDHHHARLMAESAARAQVTAALIESQTRVTEAAWAHHAEVARVEAISRTTDALVAASEARGTRAIAPGDELDVAALLKAAGHPAPIELAADDRRQSA